MHVRLEVQISGRPNLAQLCKLQSNQFVTASTSMQVAHPFNFLIPVFILQNKTSDRVLFQAFL